MSLWDFADRHPVAFVVAVIAACVAFVANSVVLATAIDSAARWRGQR